MVSMTHAHGHSRTLRQRLPPSLITSGQAISLKYWSLLKWARSSPGCWSGWDPVPIAPNWRNRCRPDVRPEGLAPHDYDSGTKGLVRTVQTSRPSARGFDG